MVYKRAKGKLYTFQGRTRHGWQAITAPTGSKPLAAKMEAMWAELATTHRAWDLLDPILQLTRNKRRTALGRLFDLWTETRMSVPEVRRRLQDVDLVPLVEPYLKVHAQQAGQGWNDHVSGYLDYLLPEGTTRRASEVTVEWLTERLYAYPASRNTLRRVHSGWSGFLAYCTDVRGLFPRNPMELVKAPTEKRAPLRFFELDAVERIIGAQDSEAMRMLFTLLYGTGIEISTALRLTRADVALGTREIRAAGTKAHNRHRIAVVMEWAWPALEKYIRPMLPTAPLFPADFEATALSRTHRATVTALKLTPACTMHTARHHWAVLNLRAGVPVAVVQAQLGHSTPMLTLMTYGPWIPTGADRQLWAQRTAESEARRKGNPGVIEQAIEQRKDASRDA
jgi:integrase